jgi:hypothetical protein
MRFKLVALACVPAIGLLACKTGDGARTLPNPYVACAHVREAVRTCQQVNNQWVCPVVLTKSSAGVPGVDPFILRATADASVVVVWSVAGDSGARFHTSDGPTWTDTPQSLLDAVTDAAPTADSNGLGAASTDPQPYYRIRWATGPSIPTQTLTYTIKYHDGNGNEVVCDPFINNSGG